MFQLLTLTLGTALGRVDLFSLNASTFYLRSALFTFIKKLLSQCLLCFLHLLLSLADCLQHHQNLFLHALSAFTDFFAANWFSRRQPHPRCPNTVLTAAGFHQLDIRQQNVYPYQWHPTHSQWHLNHAFLDVTFFSQFELYLNSSCRHPPLPASSYQLQFLEHSFCYWLQLALWLVTLTCA